MTETERILAFIDYYLPGNLAGGSVRSLANLIAALGIRFEIAVATRAHDLGSRTRYEEAKGRPPARVGNADVWYLGSGALVAVHQWRVLRRVRPDIVYFNSFFSPVYTILPLILVVLHNALRVGERIDVLIGPRGEFSEGALVKGRAKKRFYLVVFRWLGLHQYARWHASTEREAEEIRRALPGVSSAIDIAPDIAFSPSEERVARTRQKTSGSARLVFVSRIDPKKNLRLAVDLLRTVDCEISFDVYGPIGDHQYWEDVLQSACALPPNVGFRYHGALASSDVCSVFANADLFLFPTLGENFGHVIYEALSAGCPVVTSDQTPWVDLEMRSAGWSIPLSSTERYLSAIGNIVQMSENDWRVMSDNAHRYALDKFPTSEAISATATMLARELS